jgi:hypothetical protein
MFKALAVVGLIALTQAEPVIHEVDIFNPMNFVQASTPMNLVRSVIDLAQGHNLADGNVAWAVCPSAV